MYNGCVPILKLEKDDPERELEFEIEWQRSLSTAERFRMMDEGSAWFLKLMIERGQKKPFEIIKRRAR